MQFTLHTTLEERPQFVVEPRRQNIKLRNGDEKVTLECVAFGALIIWERRDGEIPSKAILGEKMPHWEFLMLEEKVLVITDVLQRIALEDK